jgi:hypothetical protein
MFKMGLHHSFGHLKHKLWLKEGPGVKVKLAIWLSTTKSRESTRFPYVKVVCDISLERSRQGLQLCFRPQLHRRCAHKVMGLQSRESPNFENFETAFGSPRTKCHLDMSLMKRHIIYYKGEGGDFPQVWAVVSIVSPNLPVARPRTKSVQTMH